MPDSSARPAALANTEALILKSACIEIFIIISLFTHCNKNNGTIKKQLI